MKVLLAIVAVLAPIDLMAQETIPRNSISAESIGMGGFGSLNYDYRFKRTTEGYFDARVGFGFFGTPHFSYALPLWLTRNYHVGNKNHFIEIGASWSFVFRNEINFTPRNYSLTSPVLGYQSISPKGFQFRIFLILPFSNEDGSWRTVSNYIPWPVIGLGKVIGKK